MQYTFPSRLGWKMTMRMAYPQLLLFASQNLSPTQAVSAHLPLHFFWPFFCLYLGSKHLFFIVVVNIQLNFLCNIQRHNCCSSASFIRTIFTAITRWACRHPNRTCSRYNICNRSWHHNSRRRPIGKPMEEINNNDFSLVHVCDTCGIRVRVLYSSTHQYRDSTMHITRALKLFKSSQWPSFLNFWTQQPFGFFFLAGRVCLSYVWMSVHVRRDTNIRR